MSTLCFFSRPREILPFLRAPLLVRWLPPNTLPRNLIVLTYGQNFLFGGHMVSHCIYELRTLDRSHSLEWSPAPGSADKTAPNPGSVERQPHLLPVWDPTGGRQAAPILWLDKAQEHTRLQGHIGITLRTRNLSQLVWHGALASPNGFGKVWV